MALSLADLKEAADLKRLLSDPRARRLHRINEIMVNLDALNLPEAEQAALRERLDRIDDTGIRILDEGIRRIVARCRDGGTEVDQAPPRQVAVS